MAPDLQDDRDPIDVFVGARVRSLRRLRKLSQQDLADHLNLSFQQVQKYERAANRISASTLHRIAALFDVPIGALFDGLPVTATHAVRSGPVHPIAAPGVDALINTTGGLGLAESFMTMSPALRAALVDIARAMARSSEISVTPPPRDTARTDVLAAPGRSRLAG